MAMLSEPRRKQKLSSDPRNKSWSTDESRFGEQMMKKMGWTEGKGLGLKENGNTSNISVTLKNNTAGLGCSQKYDDTWIHHQDDFNDLLSSLNQDHGEKDDKKPAAAAAAVPQSLQATAKKAKRRVHYNRFTKGKDLSTYSSSQMNCIMGVRSDASTPNDRSRNQSENNSDDGSEEEDCPARVGLGFASPSQPSTPSQEQDFGVQTVTSSTSIQEYFARKMKELQERRTAAAQALTNGNAVSSSNGTNSMDSTESNVESERVETERGTAEYQGKDADSAATTTKTKKKKKSKKRKQKCVDNELSENAVENVRSGNDEETDSRAKVEEDSVAQADAKRKKKEKKKKRKRGAEVAEIQRDRDEIDEEGEDSRRSPEGDATERKKRKMSKKSKKEKKKKARKMTENMQFDS